MKSYGIAMFRSVASECKQEPFSGIVKAGTPSVRSKEIKMSVFTRFIGLVTKVAIAGLLAGCAGAGSAASNAVPVVSSQLTARAPIADKRMRCPKDDGVSVRPCHVTLTASETSAVVRTRGPGGGVFVVKDTHCASKDIVTVTPLGHHRWTIAAGTSGGLCAVKFIEKDINGKSIGAAILAVNNEGS